MTTTIHQEIILKATPQRIYEAYMNEKEHSAFTGGPAEINRQAGGEFSCHGGQIVGRHIQLVENKRIVQAWRPVAWPEGVYSMVKIELAEQGGETHLTLDHWGFPEGGKEHLESGWHSNYCEPLQKYLA